MTERMQVDYLLTCQADEDADAKARGIALEQTVELPDDCVPDAIRERLVGRVERLDPLPDRRFHCTISFDSALFGGELTQLLNTLFGNISLKDGILLTDIRWPDSVLDTFGGPAHGMNGIRRMTGVPRNQGLLCTALKPVGLDARALAERAYAFARGGMDIIKDDHGVANQADAPFADRLAACQNAVTRANAETGGNSLYFPNVTAPWPVLEERLQAAKDAGCQGVLISPWITGLDAMRWARDRFGLALMAHPALTGSHFRAEHGMAPELLLGDLFRLAGADASIYPNTGGRFGFSLATCEAINHRLRYTLGGLPAAAPTPGGGMDAARASGWLEQYGADTILLIGGSLYQQGDLTSATAALRAAIGRG
ncbi:RuBisCO large subunit C-terminal-like domain-containing protein [Aquisalimonas sp.]|uniref:RuBisCO large subunit C-terminal-like domain-containing protein n=2 Tax=Aquisalimonas sp. TaxID=1872621 RepID=UPI0025B91349|nr:RuBisCO large subunit C-terminal-like domain-containing protein [Aquisalimonas sp.]